MRTIEEQLHQIVKAGIVTVQGRNDPVPEQFNLLPLVAFFPAIEPERLRDAWKTDPKSGTSETAYERMTRYLEASRSGNVTLPHLAPSAPEQATVIETAVNISQSTGAAYGQVQQRRQITIRVRSEPTTKPSTISSTLGHGLPQLQLGNIIQLQRDRDAGNDRLAIFLAVDEASDDTVVSTVRWYRTTPTPWEEIVGAMPPFPIPERTHTATADDPATDVPTDERN